VGFGHGAGWGFEGVSRWPVGRSNEGVELVVAVLVRVVMEICSPYQLNSMLALGWGAGCVFWGRALQSGRLTGTSRDGTFSVSLAEDERRTRPSDLRRGE